MLDLIDISESNQAFARALGVRHEIHKEDFIYQFVERALWKGDSEKAVKNYYSLGRNGALMAKEFSDEVARVKKRVKIPWAPTRVMDFASGFGCTSRHLAKVFSESEISACDIHEKALTFNRDVLGVTAYPSSFTPEEIQLPAQDMIFVMSLFSHLPRHLFGRWIAALGNSLAPGGALVFTCHGYVGHTTGQLGIEVGADGFGFKPQSEQHDLPGEQYGLTVSYPRFVTDAIAQCADLRLVCLREGYWWSTQDTYVCVRE